MSAKSKYAVSGVPNDKPYLLPYKNGAPSLKSSDLEAELTLARKMLRKANEKLVIVEQEKSTSFAKMRKALSEENKKLREALVAKNRVEKKSEIEISKLEGELTIAQKDVKMANQKLVLLEQEKERSTSKLKKDLKLSYEENKKLREALVAQKRAEEEYETESIFYGASKRDYYYLKAESEKNEIHLTNSLKRSEEEKACMERELNRLCSLLEKREREAEDEMKKIGLENEELRKREIDLLDKVEVLTSKVDKQDEDYDVVPKWTTSFMVSKNEDENEVEVEVKGYDSEVNFEMWESFEIDEKGLYTENVDEEVEKKMKKNKAILGKIGSLLKKGSSL